MNNEENKKQLELPIGLNSWWGDQYYDKDGKPFCVHTWKKYEGFTERYEFCTKCDEKRLLTEDEK